MLEKLLLGLAALFVLFLLWIIRRTGKPSEINPLIPSERLKKILNDRVNLYPYIVAQAKHETGNFQSRLAKEQNNFFGMKKPFLRPFVGSKNADNPYMEYRSFDESVEDLIKWMNYTNFPKKVSNTKEYVLNLKARNYFEDSVSNYSKGVQSWM